MKKYKFLLPAICTVICCMILPAAKSSMDKQTLSKDCLVSRSWGPENRVGMKIKFTPDGHFESVYDYGQSYSDGSGSYTIKDDKLSLKIESSKIDSTTAGLTLNNGTLNYDAASPKYRRYILFKAGEVKGLYLNEDLKIWDYNSITKEGEPLTINGIEASAFGAKEAVTTAIVKVRETPGVSGKEIHYSYEDMDGTVVNIKALPKDASLIVLARTKEKDKVGKFNNYWYYVEFERYIDYMRGWVYGEFVQMK